MFEITYCSLTFEQHIVNAYIPVDCEWSPYGNWTDCSASCGPGTKTARRTVSKMALNGGKLCEGSAIKSIECELQPCPGI